MKKLLALSLLLVSCAVFGQSAIIRGEESAGSYLNLKSTSGVLQTIVNSGTITVTPVATDPCASSAVAKSSVVLNISSATTTSLVAINGTTVIYVCAFTMTISQVVTTANTIQICYWHWCYLRNWYGRSNWCIRYWWRNCCASDYCCYWYWTYTYLNHLLVIGFALRLRLGAQGHLWACLPTSNNKE
jgi:hypothetical protein